MYLCFWLSDDAFCQQTQQGFQMVSSNTSSIFYQIQKQHIWWQVLSTGEDVYEWVWYEKYRVTTAVRQMWRENNICLWDVVK